MKFVLAPDLVIDTEDDRVQKEGLRVAVIAGSGGGKSNLLALFAEQGKKQGLQLVIFDTHGEYWTFSEAFEDVLIIGGDNADLPLSEDAIEVYTEAYSRGKSLVLSFKEIFLDEEIYNRIVEKIIRALWKLQVNEPRPALWAIEEAQMIAPQEKGFDVLRRVNLLKSVATGGRKFGVSFLLSTQRPAEIHKTPLSQCWIRFFGKLVEERDQDAVKSLMKPLKPEILGRLRTGQFYCYGWEEKTTLHEINRRKLTRDAGKTPLLAPIQRTAKGEQLAISDLKKLIEEKLKHAQAEKTEISVLKGKLTAKENEIEELRTKANVADVIRESLRNDSNGSRPAQTLSPEILQKLETLATYEQQIGVLKDQLAKEKDSVVRERLRLQQYEAAGRALRVLIDGSNGEAPALALPAQESVSLKDDLLQANLQADTIKGLKNSQREIYDYLAKYRGTWLSTPQIASALKRSAKSSVWTIDVGFLVRVNVIERNGTQLRVK